ncbi:unnamed protein product [Boreogadus saida]
MWPAGGGGSHDPRGEPGSVRPTGGPHDEKGPQLGGLPFTGSKQQEEGFDSGVARDNTLKTISLPDEWLSSRKKFWRPMAALDFDDFEL